MTRCRHQQRTLYNRTIATLPPEGGPGPAPLGEHVARRARQRRVAPCAPSKAQTLGTPRRHLEHGAVARRRRDNPPPRARGHRGPHPQGAARSRAPALGPGGACAAAAKAAANSTSTSRCESTSCPARSGQGRHRASPAPTWSAPIPGPCTAARLSRCPTTRHRSSERSKRNVNSNASCEAHAGGVRSSD